MANHEWEIPIHPQPSSALPISPRPSRHWPSCSCRSRACSTCKDPVCKYVDPCPEAWQPMTIHHLLTQTSGLPNFLTSPEFDDSSAIPSPGAARPSYRDLPLDFAPGKGIHYSNTNYAILGYILEKVTKTPYQAYLRKNILQPLGMQDSGLDNRFIVLPGSAPMATKAVACSQTMSIPHSSTPPLACIRPSKTSCALIRHSTPTSCCRRRRSHR